MSFFSIIIPVYNVEKYIKQCVESLINQTFKDFEAIFVDDCGSDNSMKIVEEYALKDNRIKILRNDTNKGVAAARNLALDYVTSEYFLCLDPDDWFELNTFEILHNKIKQNPNIKCLWFDGNKYYQNTGKIEEKSVLSCRGGLLDLYPERLIKLSSYTCFKVFKTELVKKAGIYWPIDVLRGEDAEFCYKYLALYPENSFIIENRLYNYRIHNQSITHTSSNGLEKAEGLCKMVLNMRDFYIKNNIYDKYRIAELQLLRYFSNSGLSWCNQDEKKQFRKTIKKLYNELGYENDFKEFDIPLNPLVSIILPLGDNCKGIDRIIESVQNQSHRNIEIICLYSNENQKNILDNYCKKDTRIKLFKTCNFNVENIDREVVTGYYTVFLNENNILNSNFVKTVVEKFKETNAQNLLISDKKNNKSAVIDDNIKKETEEKKLLQAVKNMLLEKSDYNLARYTEKYPGAFLIYGSYTMNCA